MQKEKVSHHFKPHLQFWYSGEPLYIALAQNGCTVLFLPATRRGYGQKLVNFLVTLQVYECLADVHNNWQSNSLIQIT